MKLATEQVILEEEWIAKLRALFQREDSRRRRNRVVSRLFHAILPSSAIRKISDQRINILA